MRIYFDRKHHTLYFPIYFFVVSEERKMLFNMNLILIAIDFSTQIQTKQQQIKLKNHEFL